MEKRILGIVLAVLGTIGLIYAGLTFLNGNALPREVKLMIFSGLLGAIFFFTGISLVRHTKDKPS